MSPEFVHNQRIADIVRIEFLKILSPKTLYLLITLNIAILIVVFGFFIYVDKRMTKDAKYSTDSRDWIDVHRGKISKLEAQSNMGARFDQQDEVLQSIQNALGVEGE